MSTTMVASEVKAVPPVVSSIQNIPLEKIRESRTNPRTQFDQAKLAELAEIPIKLTIARSRTSVGVLSATGHS